MNIYKKEDIITQCISEFLGTGFIVFFGISCLASMKLTNSNFNAYEISMIWGLGVSISIYFSSFLSQAHLNPAITIFFWLSSRFHKKKVLPYIISQIFGTFIFTILIYFIYYKSFILFEIQNNIVRGAQNSFDIASIFCIYPKKNNSFIHDFILEIFITSIFMIILMGLNDKNNHLLSSSSIIPLLTGILVAIINVSIGPFNNITLNPARDLGPRIFLSVIGWKVSAFTGSSNFPYFLIPVMGSFLGINLGGLIYYVFIENHFSKLKN
ncbi:aquaporin family protein [Buchnera aphidicola (Muscaphis stroyani)]|uniref:Aquaporin family protein n=1 Tax=Buchnera aphidicola (Muscaphis stroyani) TaxID=1241869 RepID=A0A4D6Y4U0_9GAMM|nr:MIP/aquaporin family protein [Buchnera aphidicola]QCI24377.1 aquaporin family protein [Buchnera aphidicola (Muscaphis stroyani)]